jgi:hypothetical protein
MERLGRVAGRRKKEEGRRKKMREKPVDGVLRESRPISLPEQTLDTSRR